MQYYVLHSTINYYIFALLFEEQRAKSKEQRAKSKKQRTKNVEHRMPNTERGTRNA